MASVVLVAAAATVVAVKHARAKKREADANLYLYGTPQDGSMAPPAYTDHEGKSKKADTQAKSGKDASATKSKRTVGQHFHKISSMAGRPLNKAAHVVGSEGWWPDTVDRECLKAAHILHSFTGLPDAGSAAGDKGKPRKEKIPAEVLENCKGLAIFTTIRAGMWSNSLTGGSGVVVARRADGSWSPPSSFLVTILGAGFMFGLDMHDCVCVLNTQEQVDAFTSPRLSLGGGATVAVGPVGGSTDLGSQRDTKLPIWSYVKSRGLWAGVHIDGTVMVSRADANATFYGENGVTAKDILRGDREWPEGGKPLVEVLKALEGRGDANQSVVDEVAAGPTPSEAFAAATGAQDNVA